MGSNPICAFYSRNRKDKVKGGRKILRVTCAGHLALVVKSTPTANMKYDKENKEKDVDSTFLKVKKTPKLDKNRLKLKKHGKRK